MRRLLGVLGAATILLSLVYVAWPVGHVPPYDANLVRLAETPLEAHCSGRAFWFSRGMGDAEAAAECREDEAGRYPDEPAMRVVEVTWCRSFLDHASAAGMNMSSAECVGILRANQLWPTYDGSLSRDWNRARPYPARYEFGTSEAGSTNSRTGSRPEVQRNAPSRGDPTYAPQEGPSPSAGSPAPTGPTGGA